MKRCNSGFSGLLWQPDRDKNNRKEFLPNREAVTAVCRDLLELRMSLIPYLYTAFADYRYQGIPPFRALVMDYPDDPNTFKLDDEYLVGESLLVAPIFGNKTRRRVYLPKGRWHDFQTGKIYTGCNYYEIRKPAAALPVKAITMDPNAIG